jgi:hypothetical protein
MSTGVKSGRKEAEERRHTGQLEIGGLLGLDKVQQDICKTRLALGLQKKERSASIGTQ